MADRDFHQGQTQGIEYIDYSVSAQGGALTTAPVADANSTSWVTWGRTATGTYNIKTVDGFVAVETAHLSFQFSSSQAGAWSYEIGTLVQNADNTWTIPFRTYQSGTLTDLPSGTSRIFARLHLNDSGAGA